MKLTAGIFFAMLLAFVPPAAQATPIVNPDPTVFAGDLDGNGYFDPISNIFSVEIFDVGEFLSLQGNTFGFFFVGSDVNNPANLFTIFDSSDTDNQQAVVNFSSGIVVDVEDAAIQTVFSGSGSIGFYLTLNAFGGVNLFSDPLLNTGNADDFGVFPFLIDPTRFAMVFADSDTGALISVVALNGVTPAAVPEPGTAFLLGLSLVGLLIARRHPEGSNRAYILAETA